MKKMDFRLNDFQAYHVGQRAQCLSGISVSLLLFHEFVYNFSLMYGARRVAPSLN